MTYYVSSGTLNLTKPNQTEDTTKTHSFLMMSTVHAQAALPSDTVGAEENAKAWLSLAQLILINMPKHG